MLKRVFWGVAILFLFASNAFAVTKIGTYGQGMNFFVTKMERSEEGPNNTVSVKGHIVNQYGQVAPYELEMICSKSGVIYVNFAGKNWNMELKDRKRLWERDAPSMGGYFAVYERYCTAKYRKSTMSEAERKSFQEND